MKRTKVLVAIALTVIIAVFATTAAAAPLPAGTQLLIEQGAGSGPNIPCETGSCFGMATAPGIVIWADIGPGTDGGIIVGKAQLSGGQEIDRESSLPGELSAAWSFYGNFGTFFTAPDGETLNLFDEASCTGADCIGKTELKVLNMALNGMIIPLGSKDGCNDPSCTADQLNGIFVSDYQIDLDKKTWSIVFNSVAQMGQLIGLTF